MARSVLISACGQYSYTSKKMLEAALHAAQAAAEKNVQQKAGRLSVSPIALFTADETGTPTLPYPEFAESSGKLPGLDWDKDLGVLQKLVAEVEAQYPEVCAIYAAGMILTQFHPSSDHAALGSFSVLLWSRQTILFGENQNRLPASCKSLQ